MTATHPPEEILTESSRLERQIELCSQKIFSTKQLKYAPGRKVFDQLDNKLCTMLAALNKQACHARLMAGEAMEMKVDNAPDQRPAD